MAQESPAGRGIYSCVDARGRTITSDRPIPACIDREQLELRPSGGIRRTIEPTRTAREQAEREEKERQEALVAARATEERRRERALLIRYPNAETHDRERTDALAQIDVVIQAAKKRLDELASDRKRIDEELEFYKGDPAKAPPSLRRRIEDNAQSMAVQKRFIDDQDDEKRRVNARFDEERSRLKALWTARGPASR
ncbi:MAG: DUF4124 domain-containing protein [Gammaproteobacteria bacterium]|nr:DUF4124 domain-containing protein [Gammaproteobacteria bacterium]MBU1441215.1 DUF4124 domain-containing protein [Gammaproteobacteria bacterium]MBU2407603.1 DUF4124 domain-containing protein [Gammaproteobacteria bacterium]